MTDLQGTKDSTVQPASRTMSFSDVIAKTFSSLREDEQLIQALILEHRERQNVLQEQIKCLFRRFKECKERLDHLETKDDQQNRLKDENLALKQMSGNFADCCSVEDIWEHRYSIERDEQQPLSLAECPLVSS